MQKGGMRSVAVKASKLCHDMCSVVNKGARKLSGDNLRTPTRVRNGLIIMRNSAQYDCFLVQIKTSGAEGKSKVARKDGSADAAG